MPTKEWRLKNREKERNYRKEWYKKNRKRAIKSVLRRRKEIRLWFNELKTKLFCKICKENHPSCLEFHHKNSKKKDFNISNAINRGYSIKKN